MIVYGKQVFFYILEKHKDKINEIFLAKECEKSEFTKITKCSKKIKKLDFKNAQSLARGGNHQGFLMDIKEFDFCEFNELKDKNFIVILYNISDVGNIGAIIRSAYALGAEGVILATKSVAVDGVIRTSSGAALDMKIALNDDILNMINELKQKGFYIYASASGGNNIHQITPKDKKVLIMGSEGFGIPSKILKKCDECVGIKMHNDFDSLNVSAAFAILCDRMING
ncbi:23S rRNA (guanosine(2251)-2'-O)-methyltransferase RlmB [Campylobacter insulaenigrae]|uniref:rRNA methyltransferase, TrmH family, group 3 n=2 Tax=Campylobacter insulaenigrae TaxID=260714 RepID=A0A0A8H2F4_9BACT|nr:23S rRNA (guanosine(2251)-2'-O)-methyltransferase RlmB [Campylobacter insulaenigrae]AJC88318.1 rRNA methyltransferase, TrmH family, group 3 [Campylobacter insulaenigrae NCTC 12927]MCR6570988.1 23S rRNA (guanosine(2251)-2'-O)-methyltransferase RlmB [Campylobacter insulaenigrae]MCR6573922.1 23S rRNA (guanosine(2251)-2'-O)-methyltransferase RlmB [Campylobacter insulaenigrae]MCR6575684.1 23S rRNA (guanosine(2251)-2'-O)-methyltransferase RlmB [Campylobacter insulaenigrae]MCR6576966.1 23S rRNA (g